MLRWSFAYRTLCAATLAIIAGAASAGSEIHRCSESGHVTYTDRGCGSSEGAVFTLASTAPAPRDANTSVDREIPVTLGMSPRTVFETVGRPVETIATLRGRQLVEYWLYRNAGGITRVAFQEGRVTGVHAR